MQTYFSAHQRPTKYIHRSTYLPVSLSIHLFSMCRLQTGGGYHRYRIFFICAINSIVRYRCTWTLTVLYSVILFHMHVTMIVCENVFAPVSLFIVADNQRQDNLIKENIKYYYYYHIISSQTTHSYTSWKWKRNEQWK